VHSCKTLGFLNEISKEAYISISSWLSIDFDESQEKIVDLSVGFDNQYYILTQVLKEGQEMDFYNVYCLVHQKREFLFSIRDYGISFAFVRSFTNGHILLSSCRNRFYKSGKMLTHSIVFTPSGKELRRFALGDGIADIKITRADVIWTSYTDEGVYSNGIWHKTIGFPQLYQWDANGKHLFTYDYHNYEDRHDSITDCYALTIGEDGGPWFYCYTGFDLCHLFQTHLTWHESEKYGCKILAIDGDYVVLAGSYSGRNDVNLLKLTKGGMTLLDTFYLVDDETGGEIKLNRAQFYEDQVAILHEGRLYRFFVGDFIS